MSNARKEFRRFFTRNFFQGFLGFVGLLVAFIVFQNFVQDHYAEWITPIRDKPVAVYAVFFVNELVLGLIPPEFFMFLHVEDPPWVYWQYITIMTLLSYAGGLSAYYFGKATRRTRFMRVIVVSPRARPWIKQFNRFGGIIILIAAVTPVPFALTSLLAGALDYRFASYVKFAFVRFLRFYPYGYAVYYLGKTQLF